MTDRKSLFLKRLAKVVCFILLLAALLHAVSYLMLPSEEIKTSEARSDEVNKVFNEDKNSLDVLFLGHSGAYSAISPMELYKEYGFTSYVCAQPVQLPWESVKLLKGVTKVQSPKLVVVEVDHLFYDKQSTESWNEIRGGFFKAFPVFRYHAAWKDWFTNDKQHSRSATKGFFLSRDVRPYTGNKKPIKTDKVYKIKKRQLKSLEKICEICAKRNIALMFVEVPSVILWDYSKYNAVKQFADEKNIPFIDMNQCFESFGFDWKTDTRDKGDHLNYSGARKVSSFLGKYIKDHYSLESRKGNPKYKSWETDLVRYEELVKGET